MSDYDTWLLNQADAYMTGCEPSVVGIHQEPQDGEIVTEQIYNCEDCDECDCEHWLEFHNEEEQEELKKVA